MATADKKSVFVNGGNGGPISPTGNPMTDLERAQDVARRYRCEFVDLTIRAASRSVQDASRSN